MFRTRLQPILFLCTGNFYRSRFAEAYFNHRASELGLARRAYSRGLAIHLVGSPLPMAEVTRLELERRGIPLGLTGPKPTQVAARDLVKAAKVIALHRGEHRPYMLQMFGQATADKITYWHVPDLEYLSSELALPMIISEVDALLEELAQNKHRMLG